MELYGEIPEIDHVNRGTAVMTMMSFVSQTNWLTAQLINSYAWI